jgi:uncharacterized protein (DUF1684 family)
MGAEGLHPAPEPLSELALTEWRREVFDMYREVRLAHDPELAHARWRERRDRLFRDSSESPLALDDLLRQTGIPYGPYDPQLRFSVAVQKTREPARRSLPTGGEEVTELRQVGWVELPAALGPRLAVWWLAQYGGGLFVPFRDQTAGNESYGAGRYLLDTAKGADLGSDGGRLILDFNFSYHPSCRYDAAWQCPLAPPENVLAGAVRAGERLCPG